MTAADMERCKAEVLACPTLEWLRAEHSPALPSRPFVDHAGVRRHSIGVPEAFTIIFRDRSTGREHRQYHRRVFRHMAHVKGWTLIQQTGAR